MKLSVAGHEIIARSVGGIETCFQLPAFDLCLDIGRCPDGAERQSRLLLTHGHIDHASGLPYYVSLRSLTNMSPPDVYCPAESLDALQTILHGWDRLDADASRCSIHGVRPNDEIILSKTAFARAFRAPHRIDAVGYTLFRRLRKLRPELDGQPEEEIAQRARAGETVYVLIDRPEICFPGDTRIEVLDMEPTVTTARVLLLECTFFPPKVDVAKARRSGHVHLEEIAAHADRFQNEVVVLTHFSKRYSNAEIQSAVETMLPESLLKRVVLLLE